MDAPEELLTRFFQAYNQGDWTAISALTTPDVDWPDQISGGRVIGHDALEVYWKSSSGLVQVELALLALAALPDGRVRADLNQSVHNASTGQLWSDNRVTQTYVLRDGLIARMDVEPETDRS